MHDNRAILERRIERTLIERILPQQARVIAPVDLQAWRLPLVDGHIAEPVHFTVARDADYQPFAVGRTWGSPWQTTWFRADVTIPPNPAATNERLEVVIDLGWADHSVGFQCEALVRDHAGTTIKALNPKSRWIPIAPSIGQTSTLFYIEAAANPLLLAVPPFQPTQDGDVATASLEDLYTLRQADLVAVNTDIEALALDIAVLHELITATTTLTDREWRILLALGHALDALDLDNLAATAPAARDILQPFLTAPALPGAHQISAIGHAHIDSAWLWPLRETRRKVNRTLANVVQLIEEGTGLKFALPAAQHAAWLKEDDPELFERVRALVKSGDIVPVGGMWVEPDAVLPGGEAMARQLVEGISWFEDNLDYTPTEIWLPDSFGYSAALPQLAQEAGISRFLTQKISWNQVDSFPHHTLQWEGIDGSRIFTHFPPVDSYNAAITGSELAYSVDNFKDKGRANHSLMPFGYGDGGGGPTREMMSRIDRLSDLAGAPHITVESPESFFNRAEADYPDAPVWVGELYLELHRGTFTSQIGAKQGNRRSEALLREAELWSATAAARGLIDYPYDELQQAWRTVLLCQFHDILPGTSIAWVYQEVARLHAEVAEVCTRLIDQALCALVNPQRGGAESPSPAPITVNASSFPARGVPAFGSGAPASQGSGIYADPGERILQNARIRLRIDEGGAVTSIRDRATGREYVPAGQQMGVFHVHQDFPNMWDAWDIDPFYRGSQTIITDTSLDSIAIEDGVAVARVSARMGASSATLQWRLAEDADHVDCDVQVDWHDHEKLLKLALPIDIHTDHAEFETQMGHITRPIHVNTSWDAYRFEVSTHRWLRLANASASMGIANDSTYGWDITRHAHEGRGTWSHVRATLVKSARYPDPNQDQGHHSWSFRLTPGASVTETIAAAQDLNVGVRTLDGVPFAPLLEVEGAVVESVSMAPDRSGDVVVRMYEGEGGASTARVRVPGATRVVATDLLYRPSERAPRVREADGAFEVDLGAFQIATLRITMDELTGGVA